MLTVPIDKKLPLFSLALQNTSLKFSAKWRLSSGSPQRDSLFSSFLLDEAAAIETLVADRQSQRDQVSHQREGLGRALINPWSHKVCIGLLQQEGSRSSVPCESSTLGRSKLDVCRQCFDKLLSRQCDVPSPSRIVRVRNSVNQNHLDSILDDRFVLTTVSQKQLIPSYAVATEDIMTQMEPIDNDTDFNSFWLIQTCFDLFILYRLQSLQSLAEATGAG